MCCSNIVYSCKLWLDFAFVKNVKLKESAAATQPSSSSSLCSSKVPCLFNLKGTFFAFCAAKMDHFISSLAYSEDIIAIYIVWSHQMNNIWTAGLEMGKSNWYNFQSKAINTHTQSFLPPFHSSVALGGDVNLWVTLNFIVYKYS